MHRWPWYSLAILLLLLVISIVVSRYRKNRDVAERLQRVLDVLLASVLVAVGLLGVVYEVLDRIGVEVRDPAPFTLRIVGLLALALGLERFTRFAHFDGRFSSLEDKLNRLGDEIGRRLSAGVLDGYDNVYDRATTLLRTSETSMRALVFANSFPVAPERFNDALIEHLKKHPTVKYHITFAANLTEVPEEFWSTVERREGGMKEAGVSRQLRITFLDTRKPIGFDILAVDHKHCCIAMSPVAPGDPKSRMESAIVFEHEPEVTKRVRSWLDNLDPLLLEQEDARRLWGRRQKGKAASAE